MAQHKCVSAQSYLFVSLNLRNGAYAKGYTNMILEIKGVIVEITNAILEITEIRSLLDRCWPTRVFADPFRGH